jgi:MFS family permease
LIFIFDLLNFPINAVDMKTRRVALLIDAVINFILGVLLLAYSPDLANLLGVPITESAFYPNLLGAIFIGITSALLVEAFKKKQTSRVGLGMFGAICVNLCGSIVLLIWLIMGNLDLPVRGMVFLWIIALSVLMVSSLELYLLLRRE